MSSRRPSWRVPEWVSTPGLELLLGHAVRELSWADVEAFCSDHTREGQVLEFKSENYKDPKGLTEFVGDVVAMANASGGLIIIGVSERDETAEQITPVPLPTGTERRLRESLSGRVRPILDGITIGSITSSSNPGEGIILVLIPPGPDTPYTATSGKFNTWPIREDATTRHMGEWEIATRYRARFSTEHTQENRMTTVVHEGAQQLVLDSRAWLMVAVAPRVSGRWEPDRDKAREWVEHQQSGTLPGMSLSVTGRVTRGRRRVVLSNDHWSGPSTDAHLELHSDGSGFAAVVIGSPGAPILDNPPLATDAISFDATRVELWVLQFVQLLGLHAVRATATGDLLIRAQLVPGTTADDALFEPGSPSTTYPLVATEPIAAGVGHLPALLAGSHQIRTPTPVDAWMPIAAIPRHDEVVKTAAELSVELIAECGQLPRTPLLRPDGTISKEALEAGGPAAVIRKWAGALAT